MWAELDRLLRVDAPVGGAQRAALHVRAGQSNELVTQPNLQGDRQHGSGRTCRTVSRRSHHVRRPHEGRPCESPTRLAASSSERPTARIRPPHRRRCPPAGSDTSAACRRRRHPRANDRSRLILGLSPPPARLPARRRVENSDGRARADKHWGVEAVDEGVRHLDDTTAMCQCGLLDQDAAMHSTRSSLPVRRAAGRSKTGRDVGNQGDLASSVLGGCSGTGCG